MTDRSTDSADDSNRSLATNGTLAAAGLALGAGATASVSAQEDEEVLVYDDDYRPNASFEVVSELTTPSKRDILAASGAEEDVFDDPDDWDAFLINYDHDGDAPLWGLLFTEHVDLSAGDSETMGDDGDFRDPRLDLIEATLS